MQLNIILYIFNIGEFKRLENKLSALRKEKKNNRAVIVGNGPSLSLEDLEKIQNADFFAFNKIYLAFQETSWRPDFYLCEDYLVLSQNLEEISRFISQNSKIVSLIAWYRQLTKIKKSNVYYFNYVTPKKNKQFFSKNPSKKIFCGYSVTYSALQLAVSLGYEEILFVGMDFEFKTKENFNKEFLLGDETQNHFIKGYRKVGEKWNKPKLNQQEKAFEYASEIISRQYSHIKVYNITRGGKFNYFPRKNIESFF
ncbi:DUF115 domain-containing protein [SAR86 cluster bacterium]|nr:DUF115 domain-containing protein [SAR86 cluster bacterium]